MTYATHAADGPRDRAPGTYDAHKAVRAESADRSAPSGSISERQRQTLWLREGLSLELLDVETTEPCAISSELPAGLGVHLFLNRSSASAISLASRMLPLDVGKGARAGPLGFVTGRREPATLVRRLPAGGILREVTVSLAPAWLQATFGPSMLGFPQAALDHLAISRWSPLHRLCLIANRMLEDGDAGRAVARVLAESTALYIVADALSTLQPPTARAPVKRNEAMRLARVQDFIERKLAEQFTVAQLAAELGVGVASLQQLFRAGCGSSVYEYVRARRLDVAQVLLEQQGLPVVDAARMVGYGSAANFATAFRRRFGVTPSEVRRGA